MFKATALIYSSHNRCQQIHKEWIVERALKSHHNKSIFLIPMSMGRYDQQNYSWGTFEWYFNKFTQYGLKASTFYWDENLRPEDVEIFFDKLINSQVVILGGGSSVLGMERYKYLGERFYGDEHLFGRILHDRQNKGLLTVGFSAGADQLAEYISGGHDYMHGFGLIRNIATTLHHDWGRDTELKKMARELPACKVFGLPNDAGIAADQGYLPSGNIWQVLEFIVDNTWDLANDAFHIKTRQGMNIPHFYRDGRNWDFKNGDMLLRVMAPDNKWEKAWIVKANGGGIFNYENQEWSGYYYVEDVFSDY
ncbi:MAG: hypothetical protein AABZ74_00510 [Cyanobacteriota bacterium]